MYAVLPRRKRNARDRVRDDDARRVADLECDLAGLRQGEGDCGGVLLLLDRGGERRTEHDELAEADRGLAADATDP